MKQDSFEAGGSDNLSSASMDNLKSWQCANAPFDRRQPGCIKLEQNIDNVKIIYRWYSINKILGLLLPAIIIMALFYQGGWIIVQEVPVFALLLFAIPIVMLYVGLVHLVNRTEITLSLDGLSIVNKPLPWPGRKKISSSEIAQLFVDKYYVQRKHGQSIHFRLNAIMRDGRKVVLIKSFEHPDPDIAKFVERIIEDQLRIKDQPVMGEVV